MTLLFYRFVRDDEGQDSYQGWDVGDQILWEPAAPGAGS